MDGERKAKKVLYVILGMLVCVVVFLVVFVGILPAVRGNKASDMSQEDVEAQINYAYEHICDELDKNNTKISVAVGTEDILLSAIEKVYDRPEYFWISRDYSILSAGANYLVQFSVFYENHDIMLEEARQEAQKIVDDMPDGTDYEKIKYVHDALCDKITYVNTQKEEAHNIYGALVTNLCVCEGYAKAFMYVLDMAGIDCYYFSGTSLMNGVAQSHAWNGLYIDGDFYYFDLTWDDIESEYIAYNNFGLNSADILRKHTFDEHHPIIESEADTYNYYVYNEFVLDTYSLEGFADIISRQEDVIDVKCGSIVAYNNLVNVIMSPYKLNEALSLAGSDMVGFSSYQYSIDDATRCIRLYLK